MNNLGKIQKLDLQTIISVIHSEGLEHQVFKILSEWIITEADIKAEANVNLKARIFAISKIAKNNKSAKNAIEGIKALCEE